ncbi:MAG: hypothetical protein AB7N91_06970 [Candidatus Tectimicrobiota bacterium]
MDMVPDLIILTHGDYTRLRREWKAAGFDVCYSAQTEQPIRLDWSPELFHNAEFLRQLNSRRPSEGCFRIASVRLTKKGNWFRPDQYSVTFHAVGALRDAAFQEYLAAQQLQSSADASRARLANV